MSARMRKDERSISVWLTGQKAMVVLQLAGVPPEKKLPDEIYTNEGADQLRRGVTIEVGRQIGDLVAAEYFVGYERRVSAPAPSPAQVMVRLPVICRTADGLLHDSRAIEIFLNDIADAHINEVGDISAIWNLGDNFDLKRAHRFITGTAAIMRDPFSTANPERASVGAEITWPRTALTAISRVVLYGLAAVGAVGLFGAVSTAYSTPQKTAPVAQESAVQSLPSPSLSPLTIQPALSDLDATHEADLLHPAKELEIILGHADNKPNHKVYVFVDPLCPYCKQLEPKLEALALNGYEIHLYPTPVHKESKPLIAGIACASDKAAAWRSAITNETVKGPTDCAAAESVNEFAISFFQQFGFAYTPTIVNEAGFSHPGAFSNDAELVAFLARDK